MVDNAGNSSDPQKRETVKRKHFALRLNVFFFSTFFLFSILIVKLAVLQFVDGPVLKAKESIIEKKDLKIAPIRGNIYDRNGFPIAYSTSTQSLYFRIEPGQKKDDVIVMATRLADIFSKYGDPEEAKKKLTADDVIKLMDVGYDLNKTEKPIIDYYSSPRRIKSDLNEKEVAYMLEHRDEFPGVDITEESVRHYDEKNTIAVQLVGYLRQYSVARNQKKSYLNYYKQEDIVKNYLDTEDVGFDGIEFMYQDELRGKNGVRSYPVDSLNKIIGAPDITPPEKGHNLYLTIDKDVQMDTEKAILDHLAYMKSPQAGKYFAMGRNATTGYAVAMEVKTGKVVAMASMPDYDPNIWRGGILADKYNTNQAYFNNGTIMTSYPDIADENERKKHPTSIVPLGSTMKPLTVLLGLNEGLITAGEKYQDRGIYFFGKDKSKITNSNSVANGAINAVGALKVSSNTYMAEMVGNRLYRKEGIDPIKTWDTYMKKFGLGVSTGSGLPNEIDGIIEYDKKSSGSAQAALVFASFGQQGRYTTLQLAQYATMLGNRGKRMQPQFVEKTTTYDGNQVVSTLEPNVLNEESFKPEYWDVINQGMLAVTKSGHVNDLFKDFPYSVASKTGTSQQQFSMGMKDNAVYIAYAPADDPVLAVAVVVPEGGFGAWGAAPIALRMFESYDEHIGLRGTPVPQDPSVSTLPMKH